ncbi:MAG: hypothetical protein ACXVDT_15615 [Bacteroidia bacterium]
MKNRIVLFITCLSIFYFSVNCIAQDNAKAKITSVTQNAQTVEFTVESTKPFYVGGNVHILHVGNKDFKLSRQTKKDGKGILTFLIPVSEWNSLTEGADVWITYGDLFKNATDQQTDIKALCEKNPQKCWYLNKFTSGLLKK